MVIEVAKENFDITFINNYVIEEYSKLEALVKELPQVYTKIESIKEDAQNEETPDLKMYSKKLNELSKEINEQKEKIVAIRWGIIQEIVETNGYEYDRKFWLRKTSPDMMNNFIFECLQKNLKNDGKVSIKKK